MDTAAVRKGYVPGAIGRVVELHGAYYHRHWSFGPFFEAKVASELGDFIRRYDPLRDGFWTASVDGRVQGSVTIDALRAADDGAHLRWFIVAEAARGAGIGRQLLRDALSFCRSRGYERIVLWTFEGLDVARRLYEGAGFRLVEERRGAQWGTEVTEQRFELRLTTPERS